MFIWEEVELVRRKRMSLTWDDRGQEGGEGGEEETVLTGDHDADDWADPPSSSPLYPPGLPAACSLSRRFLGRSLTPGSTAGHAGHRPGLDLICWSQFLGKLFQHSDGSNRKSFACCIDRFWLDSHCVRFVDLVNQTRRKRKLRVLQHPAL